MWKERKGDKATYNNLIRIFEGAGNQQCADFIRHSLTSLLVSLACKPSPSPSFAWSIKNWAIEKGPGDEAT